MTTHRAASPPLVKQEPDDDGDAHFHHRKHRHTTHAQSIASPTAQHSSSNGHSKQSAAAAWSSTSPIQPIKQLDPVQAELETLRQHNVQLQQEVAALQEKLKHTSIHSAASPTPNSSPTPIQHQHQPPNAQHIASAHTNTLSPSVPPPAVASTPPPPSHASPPPQTQSSPSAHAKEEAEVTQTTNVDGRSSCHRCKSQKDNQQLMFCTYRGEDGKRTKVCRKKYCKSCLMRWHMPSDKPGAVGGPAVGAGAGAVANSPVNNAATIVAVSGDVVGMGEEYEWWQPNCRLGWCCPACLGCCKCAACQRKYQWDVHVTSTAAAAGNGAVAGEEEMRKDVMERLQEQSAARFRTLKSSGALQRSPASSSKERKLKPAPVIAAPPTTAGTQQATPSPTLSAASLHDYHERDSVPAYALPAPSPALTVHSRSDSSTSLSSLSHPLSAEQTRQLLLNLRQGTLGPAQVAQLQLSLESQLQHMGSGGGGGGGSHYGSSDEERGSPTHSPYPESERDSPQSRASLQSYQSHATTHSAQSPYPYYGAHHSHTQPPPPPFHHVSAIAIPPALQPQPPGLISPLSATGYEQGQYGYGPAGGNGGEPYKRSDSRNSGRKRSSGSGHDYVAPLTAHAVPAVPAFHSSPHHANQQAAYAAQPPSPSFSYPATPATLHSSQYQQQQQQSQQPYSPSQPSQSPQHGYARLASPHQQHGPTQSQSHPQLSSVAHGNNAAASAYQRDNHTQNMHSMREQVLASRQQQQQPARASSSASTPKPPPVATYSPSGALSPGGYSSEPYYLQSPVSSIPFPQLNPPHGAYSLPSPYPPQLDDGESDALREWPSLSPGGGVLGSVEEGDVVSMMNESSVGGSGRGIGGGGTGVLGDDMQLSGMSLGAAGSMPLSLRADTFTPPTQE